MRRRIKQILCTETIPILPSYLVEINRSTLLSGKILARRVRRLAFQELFSVYPYILEPCCDVRACTHLTYKADRSFKNRKSILCFFLCFYVTFLATTTPACVLEYQSQFHTPQLSMYSHLFIKYYLVIIVVLPSRKMEPETSAIPAHAPAQHIRSSEDFQPLRQHPQQQCPCSPSVHSPHQLLPPVRLPPHPP